MKSSKFRLSKNNVIKALVMAVGSGCVMALLPFFTGGEKNMYDISLNDLKEALSYGVNAGVTYIVATFFTNNEGKFTKPNVK